MNDGVFSFIAGICFGAVALITVMNGCETTPRHERERFEIRAIKAGVGEYSFDTNYNKVFNFKTNNVKTNQ